VGKTLPFIHNLNLLLQAPGNGVGMKLWQCYDNLPAQNWVYNADNQFVLSGKGQQLSCHIPPPITCKFFRFMSRPEWRQFIELESTSNMAMRWRKSEPGLDLGTILSNIVYVFSGLPSPNIPRTLLYIYCVDIHQLSHLIGLDSVLLQRLH